MVRLVSRVSRRGVKDEKIERERETDRQRDFEGFCMCFKLSDIESTVWGVAWYC